MTVWFSKSSRSFEPHHCTDFPHSHWRNHRLRPRTRQARPRERRHRSRDRPPPRGPRRPRRRVPRRPPAHAQARRHEAAGRPRRVRRGQGQVRPRRRRREQRRLRHVWRGRVRARRGRARDLRDELLGRGVGLARGRALLPRGQPSRRWGTPAPVLVRLWVPGHAGHGVLLRDQVR